MQQVAAEPSWTVPKRSIRVVRDWQGQCTYSLYSPTLRLPVYGADTPERVTFLNLLDSVNCSATSAAPPSAPTPEADAAPAGSEPSTSGREDSAATSAHISDTAFFVGGPVWALDWLPGNTDGDAQQARPRYLVVGAHPHGRWKNLVNDPISGPALLQIWRVACDPPDASPPGTPVELPRMCLGIIHDGGITRDLKWCPNPAALIGRRAGTAAGAAPRENGGGAGAGIDGTGSEAGSGAEAMDVEDGAVRSGIGNGHAVENRDAVGGLPCLGVLAAVLGDGSLQVYTVPHPAALADALAAGDPDLYPSASPDQLSEASPQQPLVIRLQPEAAAGPAALTGGSMASCVEWLPAAPHDLLLAGCWDGSVVLWALAPQGSASTAGTGLPAGPHGFSLTALLHVSASDRPLRAVAWVPPRLVRGCAGDLQRAYFATGGHDGHIRVWDARDPWLPQYDTMMGRAWVTGLAWVPHPDGLVASMEDGALRYMRLQPKENQVDVLHTHAYRGSNGGALWAVDINPASQLVAYTGEDGVVGVFPGLFRDDNRQREPHTPVAGLRQDEAALGLMSLEQMRAVGGGLFDGVVSKSAARPGRKGGVRLAVDSEALHCVRWSGAAAGASWLATGGQAGVVRCMRVRNL